MKYLLVLLVILTACETQIVEPKQTSVTGYWQNTKDEVIDDIRFPFYPCVIQVVQDASGILTVVGRLNYDKIGSFPFDFNGTGVVLTDVGSISFSFTTEDVLVNGIPTKLVGQFNGNIVKDSQGEMLRGHLRINTMAFISVMHFRRTAPVTYLPKISSHNQGSIF